MGWARISCADDRFIAQICEIAQIGHGDLVLEIGPGIGALTRELAQRAGRVVAIEIDSRLIPALRARLTADRRLPDRRSRCIKTDLRALVSGWTGPIKVAANLPYYITTPLIEKILCELPDSGEMVFMVQREAADRIAGTAWQQGIQPPGGPVQPAMVRSAGNSTVPAAAFYASAARRFLRNTHK